jgi:hypothetical protein
MNRWRWYLTAGFAVVMAGCVSAGDLQKLPGEIPLAELLRPDASFALGATQDQVIKSLESRTTPWKTQGRDEFLLRRQGEQLLSNERFVQRIIASADESGIDRSYWLEFTSPLTQSRLYQSTHVLKKNSEDGGLMKLTDWSDLMLKQWGPPQRMRTLKGGTTLSYFLGPDHHPLPNGASRCREADRMFIGLRQKTGPELDAVLSYIDQTGCSVVLTIFADSWKDGLVEEWRTSLSDMKLLAEDTRLRWQMKSLQGR